MSKPYDIASATVDAAFDRYIDEINRLIDHYNTGSHGQCDFIEGMGHAGSFEMCDAVIRRLLNHYFINARCQCDFVETLAEAAGNYYDALDTWAPLHDALQGMPAGIRLQ